MKYFHFNPQEKFEIKIRASKGIVKDYLHVWRKLENSELFLVTDGELFIEQDGVKTHLKKGDYYISLNNLDYGGYEPSTAQFYWVHFSGGVFSEKQTLSGYEYSIPVTGSYGGNETLLLFMVLLKQFAIIPEKKQIAGSMINVIFNYLYLIVKNGGKDIITQVKDQRFQPITEYFSQSAYYNEFHDLPSMAAFFGYSEKYLNRLFKKYVGVSPMQFFIKHKMERAKWLLADSDMTVKAIAKQLNYEYYYFIRLFTKKTGMSPNKYRQLVSADIKVINIHKGKGTVDKK